MDNIEFTKRAVLANPIGTARTLNRTEIYDVIKAMGEDLRKADRTLTVEKSRVLAMESPDGKVLMETYGRAKAASPQSAPPAPLPSGPGGEIVGSIRLIAATIAATEGVSMATANNLAWQRNPDLLSRYNAARRGDVVMTNKAAEIVERINAIAEKIARDENKTLPTARMAAWNRNPDLRANYDNAKKSRAGAA